MPPATKIYTFGHGTAGEVELASLIRGAAVRAVLDVRTIPKSRVHEHVWADRMAQWVPDLSGATYAWCPELGGFRKADAHSRNIGLRHLAFRGYADYMQTAPFHAAIAALLEIATRQPMAIMCSETLWWRCHRRLIADALVLAHGAEVRHLMHAGAPQPHKVTAEARLLPDGNILYGAGYSATQ